MVERQDAEYTVTEQCELLGISRSGVYYRTTYRRCPNARSKS